MRSAAAILFLLAVVVGAGAESALGLEKPPMVAGGAPARGFKKPLAVAVVVPADPRGPTLGRFAVLVYSLSRNVRLTCGDVAVVEQHPDKSGRGVTYRLVLTATDARGNTYKFSAVVWGILKTPKWMLLQFNRIN